MLSNCRSLHDATPPPAPDQYSMKKFALCALAGLALVLPAARAESSATLDAQLQLTHLSADKWRVDYTLAEPVSSINFGPHTGDYRKQAWRVLTPEMTLAANTADDVISGGGKLFTRFS